MATGRLPGQAPGLQVTRWSKAPANGTTSLSGVDDYGVGLTYTAGYESVYLNGVLLDRTTDYTATNGTTVVLTTATVTGDIVNIFGTQTTPVNGAIPNSIVTTKGDLIVGSSANTPIRKAVGTDGQLLVADSTATGGVAWAGTWTTWTPTWTNLTVGNAAQTARYIQIGKVVFFWIKLELGSTSSIGTEPRFTFPISAASADAGSAAQILYAFTDTGTAYYMGQSHPIVNTQTTARLIVTNTNGTYSTASSLTSTVPFTWTSTDVIWACGSYEVA